MKIPIEIDCYVWEHLSNKQRRELIIMLIDTSPDPQRFNEVVWKLLHKHQDELD